MTTHAVIPRAASGPNSLRRLLKRRLYRRGLAVAAGIGAMLLLMRLVAPLLVSSVTDTPELIAGSDPRTLVVVVHGFGGRSREGLIELANVAFPGADVLAPRYAGGALWPFSNQSPYDISDALESRIRDAFAERKYERILLIGHSLGGELLRKVFLWGAGEEDDRPGGRRGAHPWVDRVERFVSLASINRGWTVDPAPDNMPWYRQAEYRAGIWIARLTGTGRLMLAVRRGSPFVADSRVQWIRLARRQTGVRLPVLIHLLGTRDDIATVADIKDVQAAKDFRFKSLANTDHADIATALTPELGPAGPTTDRARTILRYATLPVDQLTFDQPDPLIENRRIRRIVYILHGIRDQDTWGLDLQRQITRELAPDAETVVVVPKYGYFPMAPFLLWGDRQEKVRWFMDVYTEQLALYPNADTFDFIGHSNGTYILASALQQYRTLRIRDVYFAGSVVAQRYPWSVLVREGRVRRVRNVVATTDWVVAFFPRLYEQVAEWFGRAADPGALDIGAAGFRGFQDSGQPASGVRDIMFADGTHGAGVDLTNSARRQALIRFGRVGLDAEQDRVLEQAFATTPARVTWVDRSIDVLSNVSWLVWLLIAAVVVGIGWGARKLHALASLAYVGLVLLILNSL